MVQVHQVRIFDLFFNRTSECSKSYGVRKLEQMQNFFVDIVSPNSLRFYVNFENV